MHSRSQSYTQKRQQTTTHTITHARKKLQFSSQTTDGAKDKATETKGDIGTRIEGCETAAMVLTRLPLPAGPTDGERFSGRREREW